MSAQLVLEYYLEKYKTLANSITDIAIDNLCFLEEREPVYNMKGEKVSKSWHGEKGEEAVRLVYSKIIESYKHNNVTYPDIFQGFRKTLHYLDWAGDLVQMKSKKPYLFRLEPVFVGDGSETIIGFSSKKQRQTLKEERYSADDYLQAKNPQLYCMLYEKYGNEYNAYLRTGVKDSFVNLLNAETDPTILSALNNEVFGHEPLTVKELIIMNLQ